MGKVDSFYMEETDDSDFLETEFENPRNAIMDRGTWKGKSAYTPVEQKEWNEFCKDFAPHKPYARWEARKEGPGRYRPYIQEEPQPFLFKTMGLARRWVMMDYYGHLSHHDCEEALEEAGLYASVGSKHPQAFASQTVAHTIATFDHILHHPECYYLDKALEGVKKHLKEIQGNDTYGQRFREQLAIIPNGDAHLINLHAAVEVLTTLVEQEAAKRAADLEIGVNMPIDIVVTGKKKNKKKQHSK